MRQQTRNLLSFFFAAIPFAFALIRALKTGSDFRYLWMAFASFIAATIVIAIGKARRRQSTVPIAVSGVAFVAAALAAGSTGYLLGARAGAGIWIVSIAFAFCLAASHALRSLSEPRAT